MNYKDNFVKLSKQEAVEKAYEFLEELHKLQEKYSMSINSDHNVYLSFRSSEEGKYWDNVKIGWVGDGTGLKVMEESYSDKYEAALSKLSEADKEILGFNKLVSDIELSEKQLFLLRSSFLYYRHKAFAKFEIGISDDWDIVKARSLKEAEKYFGDMFPESRYVNLTTDILEDVKTIKLKIKEPLK